MPFRSDASEHGATLRRALEGALEGVTENRAEVGIDPTLLVVLQINLLESDHRDFLERLGVVVVGEEVIAREPSDDAYDVRVTFVDAEAKRTFLGAPWRLESNQFSSVLPVRASDGTEHEDRALFVFDEKDAAEHFAATVGETMRSQVASASSAQKRGAVKEFRLVVQFRDAVAYEAFAAEHEAYRRRATERLILTQIQRATLFDALERVDAVSPLDRTGPRLGELLASPRPGDAEPHFVDVDLWHPGSPTDVATAIGQFRDAVARLGGRVTDGPTSVADSLFLARVQGPHALLEWLTRHDRVAFVELPPEPEQYDALALSAEVRVGQLPQPQVDGPLACVIDSGLAAGHPLLDGLVIDEVDFDSGEDSTADRVGHGTAVGGIVAYGDLAEHAATNAWNPQVRLLSAKVMRLGADGRASFADEKRVETQVQEAIRHFHHEYGCRVFNFSAGHNGRPFLGGRQHTWALTLDDLARNLDILIVVPTGNALPSEPDGPTIRHAHLRLRNELYAEHRRIIDPASAAIALTVGGIATREQPSSRVGGDGRRIVVAAPKLTPAPMTRTGPPNIAGTGIVRLVKPELVADAGNLTFEHNRWNDRDPNLGVLSLNARYQSSGRLLASHVGTSFAAPRITHDAARLERHLQRLLRRAPSANLVRALLVNSATRSQELEAWLGQGVPRNPEKRLRLLRVAGYGQPDLGQAMYSADNRVTLIAEEVLGDNRFHMYELELPEAFVGSRGQRELRVTLAYDPPVRGTRQEYLSRTLKFEVFRGLSASDLEAAKSAVSSSRPLPRELDRSALEMDAATSTLQWSTVQSARRRTNDRRVFSKRPPGLNRLARIHILVTSTLRFETSQEAEQRYALVVTLSHSNNQLQLHQELRQRLTQRVRIRV